jgi:hypothetical protein
MRKRSLETIRKEGRLKIEMMAAAATLRMTRPIAVDTVVIGYIQQIQSENLLGPKAEIKMHVPCLVAVKAELSPHSQSHHPLSRSSSPVNP